MQYINILFRVMFVLVFAVVTVPARTFAAPPAFAPAGPPENTPPNSPPPVPMGLQLPSQAVGPNPPAHGLNQPPVANADSFNIAEDSGLATVRFSAPGVLINDSDPDGDTLTAVKVGGSDRVQVEFDGAVRLLMVENFNGTIEFVYDACDTSGACTRALAEIIVTPVDDPPDPRHDSFLLVQDTTLDFSAGDLFANDFEVDGDVLTIATNPTIFGATEQGGLIDFVAIGVYRYVPPAGFVGDDKKSYQVCDLIDDQPTNCQSVNVIFEVRPIEDDGWIPVPFFPTCQAFLAASGDSGTVINATIDTYPGARFDSWLARDWDSGTQYNAGNPVPGGVYIGDLSFTCVYSLPYSLTLWENVVNHFLEEITQANTYIDSIYGNTTEVHPIAWQIESLSDLFASWGLDSPSSPISSLLLFQKFGISMTAVNDPGYPEIPDSLRNAIRITITDGGRQVQRDVLIDLGLLPEEERFEFSGRPTLTID